MRIVDSATEGNTVRLPSVSFQPMAAGRCRESGVQSRC